MKPVGEKGIFAGGSDLVKSEVSQGERREQVARKKQSGENESTKGTTKERPGIKTMKKTSHLPRRGKNCGKESQGEFTTGLRLAGMKNRQQGEKRILGILRRKNRAQTGEANFPIYWEDKPKNSGISLALGARKGGGKG